MRVCEHRQIARAEGRGRRTRTVSVLIHHRALTGDARELTGMSAAARVDLDAVRGAALDRGRDALRVCGVDQGDRLPRQPIHRHRRQRSTPVKQA